MDLYAGISSIFNQNFLQSLISIILIDIVLAGDNAVVIAMAVQSLEPGKRLTGIIFGSLVAVLLRVIFTFFAAHFLAMPVVKLVGGMLILWIAVKLMTDNDQKMKSDKKAASIWQAVLIILVADVTMSLDNILAVAGASQGSVPLLIFGFGLSIPLVVFASSLISKTMQKYPMIVWVGAAIIGNVGGGMMVTDGIVVKHLLTPMHLIVMKNGTVFANHYLVLGVETATTIGVILVAVFLRRKQRTAAHKQYSS
jgi:YjbE family integral membrane protein